MADILVDDGLLSARFSRRDFVKTVGLAVAGSVLLSAGIESLTSPPVTSTTPGLLRSTFAKHVGGAFLVLNAAPGVVALRLVKVRDLRSARGAAAGSEHSFSLLFRGPLERPLLQETYELEHRRVGRFGLFVVPMRVEESGRYYEAIFNRLSAPLK